MCYCQKFGEKIHNIISSINYPLLTVPNGSVIGCSTIDLIICGGSNKEIYQVIPEK